MRAACALPVVLTAGADMLSVHTRNAEEIRTVGERLPPPLQKSGLNGLRGRLKLI